jgi:erythronate-4-phosphate dehydrogenase
MKPTILIDKNIPFIQGILEPFADVEYLDASNFTSKKIRMADALIIRTRTRCNKSLLQNSNVKLIVSATIGFDHIDTDFCERNGIEWYNTPGCNATSVAQYMASVFAFLEQKEECDLRGKKLGIVGVGNIGREVEKIAHFFEMSVLRNDPLREVLEKNEQFVSLRTIASEADIVTFHTPLTDKGNFPSRYLANADFFAQLKKQPYIINSARGGVVSEVALKIAFEKKQIAGFVLDCWENEPQVDEFLLNNAILATPHIAGYSADGKKNSTEQSVRLVSRFFGFGIDDFRLKVLALPQEVCFARNDLSRICLQSYDIEEDSEKLKTHPELFEEFRSNYPMRREILLRRK